MRIFHKETARAAELQVLMFISPRQPSLHSTWINSQASFAAASSFKLLNHVSDDKECCKNTLVQQRVMITK